MGRRETSGVFLDYSIGKGVLREGRYALSSEERVEEEGVGLS